MNNLWMQRDKPKPFIFISERFQEAWPIGWNYGFYDKPLPCPFKDADMKHYFFAGIEDGKKALDLISGGMQKRRGRPKKIVETSTKTVENSDAA
jgi:hypothetical protein